MTTSTDSTCDESVPAVNNRNASNPYRQTRLDRFFTKMSSVCNSVSRFQRTGPILDGGGGAPNRADNAEIHGFENRFFDNSDQEQVLQKDNESLLRSSYNCSQRDNVDVTNNNSQGSQHVEASILRSNDQWGDNIYMSKPSKACRLYFQNVHGLRPTQRSEGKWIDCLDVMHYYSVDIFGFTETCLNWSQRRLVQKYKTEARQRFDIVSVNHSINSYVTESEYLPGGSLQTTVGSWTGRIKQHLRDPHKMGRWTGTQYSLHDSQSLYVITLYRVGKNDQLGVISSFTQQTLALQQRFGSQTQKTPRLQVLLDLQDYLTSLDISVNDHVIVMSDANETLGEDQYGLREFMSRFRLIDLFTRYHQQDCTIATYKQSGSRRIDYIIGTSGLLPYIRNCGYLPFDKGIESDHRGLFLDLDSNIAKGYLHITSPPKRKIGYTTSKKELVRYKQYVVNKLEEENLIQRAQQLYDRADITLENDAAFISELNAVDDAITRIVLEAEESQCTKKPPLNWTPEIQNASLLIKYWQLKYKSRKHTYDISPQLVNIYQQLSPERQISIDIAQGSDRSNLRRAKFEKMKLYKLHREHMSTVTTKKLTADAEFLGIDLDKLEKCHKHKMSEDRMFKYLKTVYPKHRGTGITHIEVPMADAQGQATDDPVKASTWRSINDPQEMTAHLINRNVKHFGQASASPFATSPLKDIFGYCGTNQAAVDLVREGIPPEMRAEQQSNASTAKEILQVLANDQRLATFSDHVSHDEFWQAFRVWDEQTSTSPSGRHLGHYKSLLISDGNDISYDDDHPNPSVIIKRTYYYMAMAALYSANTLDRWCHSSTMMLEKDPGQPKIHRLRVIHLYEADYNLLLKILWARRLVRHSHKLQGLHEAQAGSRPDHRCSDVVLRKEMNYQYAKLTRTALATVDNDAKACYDRIICNLAMLVSQYFGMSNRACKLHSKTLKAMRFTIRTGGGDSTSFYTHTEETPVHGSGQGSCASPSLWLHISSILLKILDDIAQGMTRHDVRRNAQRRISAEGFVDDIALFINHTLLGTDNLNQLMEFINKDINTWQQLLASSGGKLELTKCFFYVLSWKFNKYGDPIPKTIEEIAEAIQDPITIIDPDNRQSVTLQQREVGEVHKTLGVYKSLQGTEEAQKQALLEKSIKLSTQTKLGQLTRYQARRAYTAIYMPSMTYSLVATSLSQSDLYEIQSKALGAFLPAMGFESSFPRAIVHGPRTFGGLNMGHLYTEMHVAKIGALLAHIQGNTGLGDIMMKNINWLQIHSGLSQPVFQCNQPLHYLQDDWFLHLHEFLYSIQGSIVIPNQWLPVLERVHDVSIMDVVLNNKELTNAERRICNNWRLYFQVSNLSDIAEPTGLRIQPCYWIASLVTSPSNTTRRSRHNWPCQQQPHISTFRIWKKALKTSIRIQNSGELLNPLGDWKTTPITTQNDWSDYFDTVTTSLYRKQRDGSFWLYLADRAGNQRTMYSSVPEEIVNTLPATCIPIQVDQIKDNRALTVVHRNFMGQRLSAPQSIKNFDDYLVSLPRWRSDLLMHWTTKSKEELIGLLNDTDIILIASDGSYHQDNHYGAFGAAIGTMTETIMQVRGHAPGNTTLASSFRSELYGLLAASVLMLEVTKYCSLPNVHQLTIQFYLDSQSVVDRVQYHRTHPMNLGALVASDVDVELQILEELKNLERAGYIVPPLRHVKAHQDRHIRYEDLTREAQLNVQADELATSMNTQQYFNMPYSIFPTTRIQLRINNNIITSKYKEAIRTAFLTQDLNEYYQHKFGWDDNTTDEIWWDVFGATIKSLSHSDRQKVQKFHVRRLHTNNRQTMFKSWHSDKCIFCDTHVETNDHLLKCTQCSAQRLSKKEDWKLQIFDFLSQTHTSEEIRTAIMIAVISWLEDEPIPPLESINPEASPSLSQAYQSQTKIGWDNFIRGKFSVHWAECITTHLVTWKIEPKEMTSDRWASQLLSVLWSGVLTIWEARNREIHGDDQQTQISRMRTLLLQDAQNLLQQVELLDLSEVPWLQKTLSDLEHYNVFSLKAWIRNARTIMRLHLMERRYRADIQEVGVGTDSTTTSSRSPRRRRANSNGSASDEITRCRT